MSFFDGVTFSMAGLVVLAVALLRSEIGGIILGRRVWGWITTAAALIILGVAIHSPHDYSKGINTVVVKATHEAQEVVQPVLPGMLSRLTPSPAAIGSP